jgi:N-formylglutamate deformylase
MIKAFHFTQGDSPLLVSMPHVGSALCEEMRGNVTEVTKTSADTDWHVDQLYDFLSSMGVSVLQAHYSRYVVDLNRPADGGSLYKNADETGLCPISSFASEELYLEACRPSAAQISERRLQYWQPYHDMLAAELSRIKAKYGYALLWDAHSIKSVVPRFFEGSLPDLNFGTRDGVTAPNSLLNDLAEIAENSPFSHAENGRFKGGNITHHYGDMKHNIIAIQMEISQINYMDEESFTYQPQKALALQKTLKEMILRYLIFNPL